MRPIRVLLVEDDEIDRMSVERAFRRTKSKHQIYHAGHGREALDILRGTDGRSALARPYVILLDLQMPVMNGLEFLDELRSDKLLRGAPVFILSTSRATEDLAAGYDRNIVGYMVKSSVGEEFQGAIRLVEAYWRTVTLPETSDTDLL